MFPVKVLTESRQPPTHKRMPSAHVTRLRHERNPNPRLTVRFVHVRSLKRSTNHRDESGEGSHRFPRTLTKAESPFLHMEELEGAGDYAVGF